MRLATSAAPASACSTGEGEIAPRSARDAPRRLTILVSVMVTLGLLYLLPDALAACFELDVPSPQLVRSQCAEDGVVSSNEVSDQFRTPGGATEVTVRLR